MKLPGDIKDKSRQYKELLDSILYAERDLQIAKEMEQRAKLEVLNKELMLKKMRKELLEIDGYCTSWFLRDKPETLPADIVTKPGPKI